MEEWWKVEGCDRQSCAYTYDLYLEGVSKFTVKSRFSNNETLYKGIAREAVQQAGKSAFGKYLDWNVQIVILDKKPSSPINWSQVPVHHTQTLDRGQMNRIIRGYMAINVTQAHFSCVVCRNPAHLANTSLREVYCSEECHQVRLEALTF
jgi:hypothetical protein